ncbi:MAG: DUF962 domain-containing protein [Deltaproteobacteria bacterium]|nr:DUF962 domain-containing protein [Deltaproteobacteria bacterium]
MRTATEWFELYGESHQNATNKAIHWICIPMILLSSMGLVQAIPHPFGDIAYLNWASVAWVACLVFYGSMSWTIFAGMALWGAACVAINTAIAASGLPLAWVSVGIFFVAWLAQFYGHKVEGKKPSFLNDLQFLLVGPAWLLQFVYQRVGIPVETRAAAQN